MFSRGRQSTFILTLQTTIVSYYLSKGFVFFEKKESILDKVPLHVKNKINSVEKYENDSVLKYKTSIPYIVNTLNNIYIPNTLYDFFSSTLYDGYGEIFNCILREFVRQPLK